MINLSVIYPRPLNSKWGEVIYHDRVVARGEFDEDTLLELAREEIERADKEFYASRG